ISAQKRISFGTTQERKMFPYHYAPDRLGIEMPAVGRNPLLGPGCYLGPEVSSPCTLGTKPMSTRGYAMGARTGPRFQKKARVRRWPKKRKKQQKYPPEGLSLVPVSFRPGTYNIDQPLNKKVTWPMKFGAPDWAAVPPPPQRMVKMELTMDKNFRKNQGRQAYLKMYYS
uniref:Protein pitchfork n=1 Tax=Malurus cyaneus samueli TaxID=2593467 RepID=A0A8C5TJ96_9PASS